MRTMQMKDQNLVRTVKQLFNKAVNQRADELEIARAISEAIGGITTIVMDSKRLALHNHSDAYTVGLTGLNDRQENYLMRRLIPALDYVREKSANGRIEVHYGKGMSTKHHREEFDKMLEEYAASVSGNAAGV